MAKVTDYKVKTVERIKERLDGARAIVLVDYKGINVEDVNKLRDKFRAEKVDYFIAKNTWLKIALNQLEIKDLDQYLVGPTAVAVSKNDEVAPARVLKKFVDTELENKEICSFKMGLIGTDLFDQKQLKQLANMPSKEELMAKVLGSINAPASNVVGVVSATLRQLVYVIDAIAKQKAKQN